MITYDILLRELELSSVRELEDFLINECLYTGIVRGKLDQKRRSLEVRGAIARDILPKQLDQMIETWDQWCVIAMHSQRESCAWCRRVTWRRHVRQVCMCVCVVAKRTPM